MPLPSSPAQVAEWLGPVGTTVTIMGAAITAVYLPLRSMVNARKKSDTDDARAFRDELREELKRVKVELAEKTRELEMVFDKYLAAKHEANNLKFRVEALQGEVARKQERVTELELLLARPRR